MNYPIVICNIVKIEVKDKTLPDKISDKENLPSNRKKVVYQRKISQLYWQNSTEMTTNDIYATNLFNKILHFKDLKYPLS